jgi:4'-phosphopantetheinyl transferase
MPIIYDKLIDTDCKTAIWHITESLEELSSLLVLNSKEEEYLSGIKLVEKKLQWLTSKTLLQEIFKTNQRIKIKKDAFGKPFLVDLPYQYSLSHTGAYVAISINKALVGVDIEQNKSKIERMTDKFMSKIEFNNCPAENKTEYYHVIWGAKEALFKLYGKGELIFIDHLIIHPFNFSISGGFTTANIIKENINISCKIVYEMINDCILVTAIEQ